MATMLCYRSIFLFRLLLLLPQNPICLTHGPCKLYPGSIPHPIPSKFGTHVVHDPLLIPWLFIFQNHSCMTAQAPFCPIHAHFHTILYSFISSLSCMLQTSYFQRLLMISLSTKWFVFHASVDIHYWDSALSCFKIAYIYINCSNSIVSSHSLLIFSGIDNDIVVHILVVIHASVIIRYWKSAL